MPRPTAARLVRWLSVLLLLPLSGCGREAEPPAPVPLPVTVLELRETDPALQSRMTGSVGAWKTEDVGFQVAGRIARIWFEPGEDVRGRTRDERGRVLSEGDVIAELERDRYELAVRSAEAELGTAEAKLEAARSELKNVVPTQIRAAAAKVKYTIAERNRVRNLVQKDAATQSQLDRIEAEVDTAEAELEQWTETVKVKEADVRSLEAQRDQAAEALERAGKDLADTRLKVPFHGQIADIKQIQGGYLQAGQPLATVQMMDPVKVDVAVSSKLDETLNYNDVVEIVLPDSGERLKGFVWFKDTVADPATRTFKVTLLVRNEQVAEGGPTTEEERKLYRVHTVMAPFTEGRERVAPFYVNVDALHRDEQGRYYVWKVETDAKFEQGEPPGTRLTVRKVYVTPGEKRLSYLQLATFREIEDWGEIDPADDYLVGPLFDPQGEPVRPRRPTETEAPATADSTTAEADDDQAAPPDGQEDAPADGEPPREASPIEDGDEVLFVRRRWQLRPGDFVSVNLQTESLPTGMYVPMDAIVKDANTYSVFVLREGEGGTTVERVEVDVLEQHADTQRRIVPKDEGALSSGDRIVASGAYYVTDGERVSVTQVVGSAP